MAIALSELEERPSIGLLDADVYGPSIPKMMNLNGQPELTKRKVFKVLAVQACLYNVQHHFPIFYIHSRNAMYHTYISNVNG